jgi:hypothetical protein
VIELLAALALVPTPIGPGAAYRPTAGPVAECAPRPTFAVHLELFANRRAIVIPAGIGGCSDLARTRLPIGVIEVAGGSKLDLGGFFRIWGRRLSTNRLLSFRSQAPVRAYVDGRRVAGPVARIPLRPGAQIVVELGGYVAPHASFLFPKGPA